MPDTMVHTYASRVAIQHVLDLSNYMVENLEIDTLSGSTYTVQHGKVSGGCLNEARPYQTIRIEPFWYDGQATYKLNIIDSARHRVVLTSPVLRVRVTLR